MRISRTWWVLALLALCATVRAADDKKEVEPEAESSLEGAGDDSGEDEVETVDTAESRSVQQQQAEERLDDRDKRQLAAQQHLLQRLPNLGGSSPQGFRSSPPVREQSDIGLGSAYSSTAAPVHLLRQSAQPVQVTYRATPAPSSHQLVQGIPQGIPTVYRALPTALPSPAPSAAPQRRPAPSQQAYSRAQPTRQQFADLQQVSEEATSEELEPEKEEPDRLTELLPHSKFSCQGRGTGYYADEGLSCEVFHYCQDGARHSWVCPEGFLFHQVHLICMPPSSENICQKSSAFFFVNEYLYRPVNEEEVQRKPNVSLRYSDRYYPQSYYGDAELDEAGHAGLQPQQVQSQHVPQRVPLQQGLPSRRTNSPGPAPAQAVHYQPTPRPASQNSPQPSFRQANPNQVFHSPEEVNIPLQLRRPAATTARSFQPTVASPSSEEYEDDEPVYRQG